MVKRWMILVLIIGASLGGGCHFRGPFLSLLESVGAVEYPNVLVECRDAIGSVLKANAFNDIDSTNPNPDPQPFWRGYVRAGKSGGKTVVIMYWHSMEQSSGDLTISIADNSHIVGGKELREESQGILRTIEMVIHDDPCREGSDGR